jgi:hypothetical protein
MSINTPADTFFDNVCELDLVFNFYKVRVAPPTLAEAQS